ncbi:MAG: TonB-dependent receptor [Candidatus Marinimicrobia bacterium]|nr:TonB-dependent receptor [Candidatus Neomarinimicrobiota bacterium]
MKTLKFFSIFLFFINIVFAQATGKIVGTVYDSENKPLLGVNIVVIGTFVGASTDADGQFIIINVPSGNHTVKASYIGFQTVSVKDVFIRANLTSRLKIKMKKKVLNMDEEITVIAKRPVIQKDATGKVTTYSAEELQTMPIDNLQDILATQSNVSVLTNTPNSKSGYNIRGIDDVRMRGGRNNEVSLLIDGVKVSNPIFGGFGTQISKNAIKQISVESGGFSAKYGNALSGVVNLSTKDTRDKWTGSLSYNSSKPFGMDFLTNEKGVALQKQNFQVTLGGRIPLLKKWSFFISGEMNQQAGTILKFDDILWDDYRALEIDSDGDGVTDSTLMLPTSQEIIDGYLKYKSLDSVQANLSSNWDEVVGPDGREINPIDNIEGWQGMGWNNYMNMFGKLIFQMNKRTQVRFSFLNNHQFRQVNNFNAYYDYNMSGQNVQIRNSDKETMVVNHTVSSKTFFNFRVSRFYSERRVRVLKDYTNPYLNEYNIFQPNENNLKSPDEYIPYASTDAMRDPFESSFYILADNRWYSGDKSTNYEARFDFTSQFHKNHKIETGVQVNQIDLYYHSYQNVTKKDLFPTIYHHKPIEGACYIQQKSEFYSLIMNFGLRMDYVDSGSDFWSDPFDPLGTQLGGSDTLEYNSITKAESKINLSPRIGLAYPLTDKSVIFFNFGHFYQNPNYRDLYRASGGNREISLTLGNIIGNPNLQPEKAVQYEIGLQQQFGADIGVKINLWSKETTNQVGSVVVPAYSDPGRDNPFTYSVFVNNNFGSAKGIDINIKKKSREGVGFDINYSLSQAKVLHATSWDGYWSGDTEDELPKHETRAPWDQTHVLRANVHYILGSKKGFRLSNIYPLQNTVFNMIYYGENGMPYTPSISGGVIVKPYSERWEDSHRFDIRISKAIYFSNNQFRFFLEVKNIFDRKNMMSGYTKTGSATDPGTASYYTMSSTYWDSRNNNNFAMRRSIYFGVETIFGGR